MRTSTSAALRLRRIDDGFAQRRIEFDQRLAKHQRHGIISSETFDFAARISGNSRAMATKPATGIVSARAVGSTPAAASSGAGSTPSDLQALAQHLAALAEGGCGDALEQAAVAGAGLGARHQVAPPTRSPSAAARRRRARCRTGFSLRCASPPAPRAGRRPRRLPRATMRSATSRWNISTITSYHGGHGSVAEPADQQRRGDVVGQVGDDLGALAVQQRARIECHARRP